MMNKLLIITVLVCGVFMIPRVTHAAIVHLLDATSTTPTGVTTLAAPAKSHAAGDLILVCTKWENNTNATGVTDTAGNTYTPLTQVNNSGGLGEPHTRVFYTYATAGNASNIVTVTFSASSNFSAIFVSNFSGASATPFDVEPTGGKSTTGSSLATGSFTTTQADEVLWSCESGYQPLTYTSPAFGGVAATKIGGITDAAAHWLVVSSIQTAITSTITQSVADRWTIAAASFKQAAAAPATPLGPPICLIKGGTIIKRGVVIK